MGDINIDCLKPSKQHTDFNELLIEYGMARVLLPPTRITPTSSTSIDAVCASAELISEITTQVIQTGISDHTGQQCEVNRKVSLKSSISSFRRYLNDENLSNLKACLKEETWENVYRALDVESSYNTFLNIVTSFLNFTCPLKKSRRSNRKRKFYCYDEEVNLMKTQFLAAQERFTLSGRQEHKRLASDLKRNYDMKLKQLRKEVNLELLLKSENKSRALWKTINMERAQKNVDHHSHKLKIDGKLVSYSGTLADHFNTYFSTIAERTLQETQTPRLPRKAITDPPVVSFPMAALHPTDFHEMFETIRGLKPKASAGLDEISSRILKYCSEELIPPLVHITNISFKSGEFPEKLKMSKVVPLHKKGPREDVGNFRPISLISTFSKVIEKIVLKRIFDHLSRNNLQTDKQHGFMSKKSTLTALVDMVEHIIDRIEEGDTVTGIFLDMTKAFDCLGHGLILEKLSLLGFRENALNWFTNYLRGRQQLVELEEVQNGLLSKIRSVPRPMSRGVPQGSVLGPILFILFTNDFPGFLDQHCYTVMYADDSVLLTSGRSAESVEISAYVALGFAEEYCSNNDLIFNQSKTKQLTFGCKRDQLSPLPGLLAVDNTKHLGVVVDERLSWQDHLDHLCRRLSSALYALRRTKSVSTHEAVLVAYHALFESHLRYGIAVWGSAAHVHLERVLILQKKALKIMYGLDWQESCRGIFQENHILTVISIYIIETIVMTSTKNLLRNNEVHGYNTRNGVNYNLPAHRLKLFQRKPSYAGSKFFNLLPQELKNVNQKNLKKRLIRWFSEMPFYSVNEFLDWQHFNIT